MTKTTRNNWLTEGPDRLEFGDIGGNIGNHLVFLAAGATASVAWTDMPAALTEFQGFTRNRLAVDLSIYTDARVMVNIGSTAGGASAEIRVQYSLDSGSNWFYLDSVAGPTVSISGTANALKVGAWASIVVAARADVWLRVVGVGGDGVIDPTFNIVQLEVQ
jgi:hypothetical protein